MEEFWNQNSAEECMKLLNYCVARQGWLVLELCSEGPLPHPVLTLLPSPGQCLGLHIAFWTPLLYIVLRGLHCPSFSKSPLFFWSSSWVAVPLASLVSSVLGTIQYTFDAYPVPWSVMSLQDPKMNAMWSVAPDLAFQGDSQQRWQTKLCRISDGQSLSGNTFAFYQDLFEDSHLPSKDIFFVKNNLKKIFLCVCLESSKAILITCRRLGKQRKI